MDRWQKLSIVSKKKNSLARTPNGLSKKQEDFCVQYVYGGSMQSHTQWAKQFKVSPMTISKWLKDSNVMAFLTALREERKVQLSDSCVSKVGDMMGVLEQVAKTGADYVVNKGTAREVTRVDAEVLDIKRKAVESYMKILHSDFSDGKNTVVVNNNLQQPGHIDSIVAPSKNELNDIELELKKYQALNDDESLIEQNE